MNDFDDIHTINAFWEKFKEDILKDAGERQVDTARTIFYVACSGMYAILKSNMFDEDRDIHQKIAFMKNIEVEILKFGDKIFHPDPAPLKH